MIEVRLLGQQSVVAADGSEILSISAQPKRLALLVYMAVSGATSDGYVSRDELQALFWPESDQDHSRNTLNQHIFRLRGSLGSEAILSRGSGSLGVDGEQVWCDVVEFQAAIKAKEQDRALSLYAGDFLGGFHVSATPELEKWLDNQRLTCQRQALEAALALAREAERASDWAEAVKRYRRATEIASASESAVRGLSSAIASAENRALKPVSSAESDPGHQGDIASVHPKVAAWWRSPVTLVAAALIAVGGIVGWRTLITPSDASTPLPRLAVLPFTNFLGDTAQNYLVDGLHNAVIAELGQAGNIPVISYTSVIRYRNSAKTLPEIALELDVDAIVEASVRRMGDSVQIRVRLLDPESEQELWTGTYEDELPDVLAVINQAHRSMTGEIQSLLNPEDPVVVVRPHRLDPTAQDAYLRGDYLGRAGTPAGDSLATDYFRQAVKIDSSYAQAWVGLGRILEHRGGWFGDLSPVRAMPEARNALEKALRLDSSNAEAHLGLASIKFVFYWDWTGAEVEYRRSLELNPHSADAHNAYGNFLRAMRRVEEGLIHLRRSVELDPLEPGNWSELSMFHTHLGQFEEARDAVSEAVALGPNASWTKFVLALQLFGEGNPREAADVFASMELLAVAAQIYAGTGDETIAREYLAELEGRPKRNHVSIAATHFLLGDTASALDWLERGWETRDPNMVWVNFAGYGSSDGYHPIAEGWPRLNLGSHPQFQALTAKMNFPDKPASTD